MPKESFSFIAKVLLRNEKTVFKIRLGVFSFIRRKYEKNLLYFDLYFIGSACFVWQ